MDAGDAMDAGVEAEADTEADRGASTEADDRDTGAAARPVCSVCRRTPAAAEAATARLTWSRGTQGGRVSWVCERCSRDHVRSIEGKLDPSWW